MQSSSHIYVDDLQIPYYEIGLNNNSNIPRIHFTGANGFPALVYQNFLEQFSKHFYLSAADCRGASPNRSRPRKKFGFDDLAEDLIKMIEMLHDKPVIGMGHSFGAHITLLAAIKRPELFVKLVLIEPASLPHALLDWFYRRLPEFILHQMVPMIKQTKQRKRIWRSRDEFLARYSAHPTFKHFTPSALKLYSEHGLFKQDSGVYELVFDPRWESHIFGQVEYIWKNLRKTNVPTLFLKAENSYLYTNSLFEQENKKLGTNITGFDIPNTHHMMPLEDPQICFDAILPHLSSET